MSTKGAVKNTRLAPAPIDNCPAFGVGEMLINMTSSNETMVSYLMNNATEMMPLVATTAASVSGYSEP